MGLSLKDFNLIREHYRDLTQELEPAALLSTGLEHFAAFLGELTIDNTQESERALRIWFEWARRDATLRYCLANGSWGSPTYERAKEEELRLREGLLALRSAAEKVDEALRAKIENVFITDED